MNLSTLTGDAKPYLEYAWVCAPNTAGQSITANTITTLTIDTEVADTGNYGSIASNQITLAAGTYLYKGMAAYGYNGAYANSAILSLYNTTSSSYVSKKNTGTVYYTELLIEGQFVIAAQSVFELRTITSGGGIVGSNYNNGGVFTLATANADQRTTLKLWKLA